MLNEEEKDSLYKSVFRTQNMFTTVKKPSLFQSMHPPLFSERDTFVHRLIF